MALRLIKLCCRSTVASESVLENRFSTLRSRNILKYASRRLTHQGQAQLQDQEAANDASSIFDFEDDCSSNAELGNSLFWRRKMRTLHALLDVNKDGIISFDDFKLLADNFVQLGHLTPSQQEEFHSTLQRIWEKQWGYIDRYNLVTMEKYLLQMKLAVNDLESRSKIHEFLPYMFKAVDKDGDGIISIPEFKLFFQCVGLTPEDATVSFKVIDNNNDENITLKEFVTLGRDFFLSEDETKPSKMFWGPLVQ